MWSGFPNPLYPQPLLWTPPFLCKLSPVIPAAWEGHTQLADALCPWWLPCKPQVRQHDMSIFSNFPTRWAIHPRRNTCWFLQARPPLLSGAFIQKRAPSISSSVLPQMREIRMPQGPSMRKVKVRKSFKMHVWAWIYNQKVLLSYSSLN